jgi:chromosome segregation ATPase
MQLQQTTEQWAGVLADLTSKARTYDTEIADLVSDRDGLALDAELGVDGASRKLQKINADLAGKQTAAQSLRTAIAQAQRYLEEARGAEADAAEQERQEQIAASLELYFAEVQKIDVTLKQLAATFATVTEHLNRAESFMNGQERQAINQLRSLFGATCAAAHFGLGESIQLGPQAAHTIHRQPLARYVGGFVDRWLKPTQPDQEAA